MPQVVYWQRNDLATAEVGLALVGQIEFGENTLFGIGGRFSF